MTAARAGWSPLLPLSLGGWLGGACVSTGLQPAGPAEAEGKVPTPTAGRQACNSAASPVHSPNCCALFQGGRSSKAGVEVLHVLIVEQVRLRRGHACKVGDCEFPAARMSLDVDR